MSRSFLAILSIVILGGTLGITPPAMSAEAPVFLGLYPGPLQNQILQLQEVDAWLGTPGRRLTIAGNFMDFEFQNPAFNVPAELNGAWDAGYVPFVNLLSGHTSIQIANGAVDAAITTWANYFATWASQGGRRAFLAPLAEMNGYWTPYYGPPADFIAAYRRIRQIFANALAAKGVLHNAISWVFVPSGFSLAGDEFERFYAGHNEVDVVAFSAYNYGGCPPAAPWVVWETYDIAMKPYLDRMRVMAPGKPIFIAQTGVIDKPVNSGDSKDQWLRDTYGSLATYPGLRGIIYFNFVLQNRPDLSNCPIVDFRVHIPGTSLWQGFKDAVTNPIFNFGYWAPNSVEMSTIVFAPTAPQVFADVVPIHPFAAEPGEADVSPWIQTLADSGITTGCAVNPPRFCPTDIVTRAQMAVFLGKGIHGATYSPPAATGTVFRDVTGGLFAPWIEQLARDGITGGCGGGNYCPDASVTRAQMAVFILKAIHGAAYSPPAATGTAFNDVKGGSFAPWIEELAREGITGGCSGGNYCPDASVTRQAMAVFLVRAFNL